MTTGETILNLTGLRKLALMRQAEAAECGLACVGMVAAYFGFKAELSALRRDHPISINGTTLANLVDIGRQMHLSARALRCELDELRKLRTPAILHWDMNHFVVLKRATRSHVMLHDPARGVVRLRLHEVSSHFTGVALELAPTAAFRRKREKKQVKLSNLIQLSGVTTTALCQAIVISLLLQVFVLASPYFMQLVIDQAVLKGDLSLLGAIAAAFAALKVFEVATQVLRGLVLQFLSSALSFDVKARLFHHMTRLPLEYFHRRHVGDIQQRFQSLQPITDFVANGAVAALFDGILAATIAALLFAYDSQLALLVCGSLLFYVGVRWVLLRLTIRLTGDLIEAQAKESTKFLETIRAVQTIKIAGAESAREGAWRNLNADAVNGNIRVGNVSIVNAGMGQAIIGLSTVLLVFLCAQRAIDNSMTVGMIAALVAYKGQLDQRVTAFVDQVINWRLLDVHLERIADIALHSIERGHDNLRTERLMGGALEVRGVRFRYAPHEPDILKDVSFAVQPGEFVAIAGPSGCGKSTLLKVLVGLYEQTDGTVSVDGIPLASLSVQEFRRQIGVVMQDDTLLAGSIAENVAMFDDRIDMDHVRECARLAQIHDHIERMPMGYRSLVGDMGSSLSGGQQQRIMLARALYKRPKILIMDEGTSQVDTETEARINVGLKSLQITRVVVAHREETIRSAERVILMKAGRLVTPTTERLSMQLD